MKVFHLITSPGRISFQHPAALSLALLTRPRCAGRPLRDVSATELIITTLAKLGSSAEQVVVVGRVKERAAIARLDLLISSYLLFSFSLLLNFPSFTTQLPAKLFTNIHTNSHKRRPKSKIYLFHRDRFSGKVKVRPAESVEKVESGLVGAREN